MRQTWFGALALVFLAASGCGSGHGDLGSTPQETNKLQAENLKAITATLEKITSDATAAAALPQLEQAVARQSALKKKVDSYNMSIEEAKKVMSSGFGNLMQAGLDLATAQFNAMQKAPGKANELQAVLAKLNEGRVTPGGPPPRR